MAQINFFYYSQAGAWETNGYANKKIPSQFSLSLPRSTGILPVLPFPALHATFPLPHNHLQHIMFRQAEVAVAADDQVVVHRQVEGLAGLDHGLGQFLIRGRRGGIAAGVVVD